jgi:FtsH-binding integral membrane protein
MVSIKFNAYENKIMSDSNMMLKSDVFQRTETDSPVVSDSRYNAIIGLVLCWGFLINWLIVGFVDASSLLDINPIVFILIYFASCVYGIYLFNSSSISRYDPGLVIEAIGITAIVTFIMMVCGTIYPRFFERIYNVLLIALFAVILIELFQIYVLNVARNWTDWIVVIIFCGYIGYDWGRANCIPKTIDNAVDSAAAIYMDIINLFVRILKILGRRRR